MDQSKPVKKTPEAIVKLIMALVVTEGSLAPPNSFGRTVPTLSGSVELVVVESLALGIFNFIPVPPLVGGDAFVLAIGLIRRRGKPGGIAEAKGIVGICGVLIAGLLIGFGIYLFSWTFTFFGLWTVLVGFFFLESAMKVIRATFSRRLILVLILASTVGIPLIFLIGRIAGLSLPVPNADKVAQIVRWTELNRYWSV